MEFTKSLILLCVLFISQAASIETGIYLCETGWYQYSDRCYYVSTSRATWYEAQNKCRVMDAWLASIPDEAEKNFIAQITNVTVRDYWIGLYNGRSWGWTDGTTLSYTNWLTTRWVIEPNGSGKCGRIAVNNTWRDTNCNRSRNRHDIYYICKKDALLPTTTLDSTSYFSSNTVGSEGTSMLILRDDGRQGLVLSLSVAVPLIIVIAIILVIVALILVRRRRKPSDNRVVENEYSIAPVNPTVTSPEQLPAPEQLPGNAPANYLYSEVHEVKPKPANRAADSSAETDAVTSPEQHPNDMPANYLYSEVQKVKPKPANRANRAVDSCDADGVGDLYGKVNKPRTDRDELEIHENESYAVFGDS